MINETRTKPEGRQTQVKPYKMFVQNQRIDRLANRKLYKFSEVKQLSIKLNKSSSSTQSIQGSSMIKPMTKNDTMNLKDHKLKYSNDEKDKAWNEKTIRRCFSSYYQSKMKFTMIIIISYIPSLQKFQRYTNTSQSQPESLLSFNLISLHWFHFLPLLLPLPAPIPLLLTQRFPHPTS